MQAAADSGMLSFAGSCSTLHLSGELIEVGVSGDWTQVMSACCQRVKKREQMQAEHMYCHAHRAAVAGPERRPDVAAVVADNGHGGGGALWAQPAGGHGAQAARL